MIDTPRIYVACLASYNNGTLHGKWIDATDSNTVREEIQKMLKASPVPMAEEWAIHDYEGFQGLSISEYEDIDTVAELAELIAEHGPAFAAYAEHAGSNHATVEGFQDAYCGEWGSEKEYAEHLFDELYLHEIPEHLHHYVDYDAFARDIFIDDCSSVHGETGVYVFHRC